MSKTRSRGSLPGEHLAWLIVRLSRPSPGSDPLFFLLGRRTRRKGTTGEIANSSLRRCVAAVESSQSNKIARTICGHEPSQYRPWAFIFDIPLNYLSNFFLFLLFARALEISSISFQFIRPLLWLSETWHSRMDEPNYSFATRYRKSNINQTIKTTQPTMVSNNCVCDLWVHMNTVFFMMKSINKYLYIVSKRKFG